MNSDEDIDEDIEGEIEEDLMRKKLEEHRNVIDVVLLIGKKEGIKIKRTSKFHPKGDFSYEEEDHDKVVNAIDKYLGEYKWEAKNTAK
jgi:hypothetical protein